MKQIVYHQFGDPARVLEVLEKDAVTLKAGQARVEVLRAPINPSDVIQVAGQYGVMPDLPAVAGNEGLGRVTEVNGDGIAVGQLVLLPAGAGTWVSEVVADIHTLAAMPEGDLDQLAMLTVNPATAHLLLTDFVDLKEGDWVIQSAANSAVGNYVVQLAKAKGIKTACVVRRDSAVAEMEEVGADAVLVDGPDLAKRVRQAAGAKMKLALDAVAGETFGHLAETLEQGGTLVNYGAMSMQPISMPALNLIFNDIRVRGFWLVHWFSNASKEERMQVYGSLTQAVANGTLHAPIDRHFSLDEIAEAVTYTMAGERKGKVLLAPNGM
ncbi:zinc-dependent alcohol dehydrogenase family protein [Thalassococcus sp. S3]|uniref:zinc-dependent alcohol dehydrogenase family protein n=1 Tax=Thalassococcus sp. S3 TaxID=2017482 RepID=UPI001023FD8D|nr:zinc-dependent alcohol dehydrogenase family protein [Thalassococcus sp. S3]QBF33788.1 alcohol dehydrogenase [Thalassococcus sp. S3]